MSVSGGIGRGTLFSQDAMACLGGLPFGQEGFAAVYFPTSNSPSHNIHPVTSRQASTEKAPATQMKLPLGSPAN